MNALRQCYSVMVLGMLSASIAPVLAQTTVAMSNEARDSARHVNNLLARPVTLDVTKVSRTRAIDMAAAATNVAVQYQTQMFDAYPEPITLHAKKMPLGTVLEHALAGTPFRVVADGATRLAIVRMRSDALLQQKTGSIEGRVVDSATGQSIAGAAATVAEQKWSPVITDKSGHFAIKNVPAGEYTLLVKLLGYRPFTKNVTVSGEEATAVGVSLVPSASILSQVVTTAVGTQRRLDVGNAITTLNVDEIRKNAPVATVTDLLDGRVPDLIVTRGSGAPGSPSRVRIRGVSSINGSNDPIIVVDGVRTYSAQTTNERDAQYSVLDHIDINTIEKIDILKGPSASSLYGSDAANGVILITTKRGIAGKTRWTFGTDQTITTQPGAFASHAIVEGVDLIGGIPQRCTLEANFCANPHMIVYNPLGDERTTLFGTGYNQSYRADVSGGSSTMRYFLGAESSKDLGLLKMSDADVAYVTELTGRPVPKSQRRPQSSGRSGVTSRISMQVTPSLITDLSSSLHQTDRRDSPLSGGLALIETELLPSDTLLVESRIQDFRRRFTWREMTWRNIANADWTPLGWLVTHADVGLTNSTRDQDGLLRRGDCAGCTSEGGALSAGRDLRSVGAMTVRAAATVPSVRGITFTPSAGVNYVRTKFQYTQIEATNLALGSTSVNSASSVTVRDSGGVPVQVGVFFSTGVNLFNQFSTSFGFRTDASNSLGKQVIPSYPKLDLSYVIPTSRIASTSALSLLRVRLAYGHSAVQPELGASLRTYSGGSGVQGPGTVGPILNLSTLGNPNLRPERSTEIEGGIDTRFAGDRVTVSATMYRKLSRDALVTVNRPPSVGEGTLTTNLGSVRNLGGDVSVDMLMIDRPAFRWNLNGALSKNTNTLVSISPAYDRDFQKQLGFTDVLGRRNVEGYPIGGIWMRPVVSYGDANQDGIITQSEIVRSDSTVFVGGPLPKYDLSLSTTLGLWHERVTLAANTQYQNGAAQINEALLFNVFKGFSTVPALSNPDASLAEQMAYKSGYAFMHEVSTFRLQSVSIRVAVSDKLARRLFRASTMSLALQGSNVALWSDYKGVDPNVTKSIVGNTIADYGTLPQPRTWGLNVALNY